MQQSPMIKPRDREAILRSLRSGVVPSVGLQHIQVGRHQEVASFLRDIDTVRDGGASFRLLVGEYGSGKTFFLSLVRSLAMERGLVVMNADLSPQKRLHSTTGQARRLLEELIGSLSTRTKRDGAALSVLLERLAQQPDALERIKPLAAMPMGHTFVQVVGMWLTTTDTEVKASAERWLKAQYATRTDAMRDLGVREILADDALFPALRLYAALARAASFGGLYVCLDEVVNLYKITNTVSRKANYEEILSMLNNTLQGNVAGLGIVMGATPETLTDTRRGFYSYEALRSRLAENNLTSQTGLKDYDSTVLRLANLTKEELYVLLKNIRRIYASGDPSMADRLPDEALQAFLQHCFAKVGESYFRTPRNTIKAFIDLASLLRQYPDATWQSLLGTISIDIDREPSALTATAPAASASDLVDFRL